jgi:hypothetical protein
MKSWMVRLLIIVLSGYIFISQMTDVAAAKRLIYLVTAVLSFFFFFLIKRKFELDKAIIIAIITFVIVAIISFVTIIEWGLDTGKAIENGAFTGFLTGSYLFLMPQWLTKKK